MESFIKMKEQILQSLIADLENSITSFKDSISELKGLSDIDENSTKDTEDLSHQNVSKDMEMRYNLLLRQAKDDLNAVRQLMQKETKKVAPGALIETDKKWFFVGISNAAVNIEGKELVCFSTSAPIYKILEGGKAGSNFNLGKITYTILNIY